MNSNREMEHMRASNWLNAFTCQALTEADLAQLVREARTAGYDNDTVSMWVEAATVVER